MSAFWAFLIRDPWRKIIALVLTVILYVVLNEGKQQQKDLLNIPVEIKADDEVFIPNVNRSTAVRVTVRGSESRIKKLNIQDIRGAVEITCNTPGFQSGNVTLFLEPKDFVSSRGIEIVSIEPSRLVVPVQRRISRDVPVAPIVVGQPRQGLAHDGGKAQPDMVRVSGPERAVRNLQTLKTEILRIRQDESRSFSKSIALESPGDEFTLSTQMVDVTVTITDDMSRSLPWLVPVLWNLPLQRNVKIFPERESVTVTVSGQQDEIKRISENEIMVYADLRDSAYDKPGDYIVPLKAVVNIPGKFIRVTRIEPDKIRIRCEKLPGANDRGSTDKTNKK
ncbi:MAG: hypothetical protein E7057_02890 [Lentisphaerae bacterium]|nr:hypothetical protein [Lentisphaerota bacterium]